MINNYKRIICYADILGFSDKILAYSMDEKMNIYESLIKKYRSSSLDPIISRNGKKIVTKNNIVLCTRLSHIAWFSDSIILFSEPLTEQNRNKEINNLLHSSQKLFSKLLLSNYPLRGAIEIGDFYADIKKNIYVGKGLITAHALSENCDWSGIIFTEAASQYMLTNEIQNANPNIKIQYKVPLKSGEVKSYDVLNWANYTEKITDKIVTESFKIKSGVNNWSVHRKLENTLAFFNKYK